LPAFEKLESPDHFVHMSSVFKEGSSNIVLRASTVRPTPPSRARERSELKNELAAAAPKRLPSFVRAKRAGATGERKKY
jgi:hypothetical protein